MTNALKDQGLTLSELKDWLNSQGFAVGAHNIPSGHNLCDWYAWRKLKSSVRPCELNGSKGPQLVITPSHFQTGDTDIQSVKVDLRGEAGGVWWDLQAYSLTADEVVEKIDQIEAALTRAWGALVIDGEVGS